MVLLLPLIRTVGSGPAPRRERAYPLTPTTDPLVLYWMVGVGVKLKTAACRFGPDHPT